MMRNGREGRGVRHERSALASQASRLAPRGFTLIEMLVVIIIMAVFASIAVPSYSRFESKARFQKTAQDAADILAWARDAAIQYSADATVQYDAQSGTLSATVDAPAATTDMPTAMQDTQDLAAQPDPRVLSLGENVQIVGFYGGAAANDQPLGAPSPVVDSQQNGITFHEDGSADGGGFTVVSADGHTATVQVVAATGRAYVTQDALQ